MDPVRLILGDSAKKKALQGPSKVNIGSKMCSRAQYWRVCQQKDTNIPFSQHRKSIYFKGFLKKIKPKKNIYLQIFEKIELKK